MANKTVTFTTREETCDGVTKKYISVDQSNLVLPNKNWVIKFQNDLDEDAEVQFFDIDDKGDASDVIGGFCKDNSGNTLEIDESKHENCKPEEHGNYAYTVEATGYETLDPVVIIEPLGAYSLTSLIVALAAGGAAGLIGPRLFGAKKDTKENG